MRKRPVLSTAHDLVGLRVNGHHAAARKRSDVRAATFIESQIPRCDRAAPIAQYVTEDSGPLAQIRQITRIGIVWAAFSPMHLDFRIGLLDSTHHVWSPIVAMPSNRIGIFTQLFV